MKRKISIFRVLPAVIALICLLALPASAASVNGISASVTEAAPGDRFTIFIDVPGSSNGDTLSIRAEYDPDVFEVVSWNPDVPNCISNIGDGFIVVTSANVQRVINLSGGMHLSAEAVVKRNAPSGSYDIRLVTSSISYVKDNGYEYAELWYPSSFSARVRVNGSSSGGSSRDDRGVEDETEEVYDTDDDIVDGYDEPVEDEYGIDDEFLDDDDVVPIDDDDEHYETEEPDYADEEDEPYFPQPASDAKITLDSRLTGLSAGNIRLSTKSYFFENDTTVELRNTDPYGSDAELAAKSLGFDSHDRYSFDITLRETDTGKTLTSLGDGYIELAMPLPDRMKTSPEALKVYHIEDGFPRLIASNITIEDGTAKICFRANAFSPYMIIDTVNEYYPEPVIISDSGTANAGRPINPATGVAAAVLIPAALVGCVVLAKKNGKRKRAKKDHGGEDDDETE